MSKMNRKQFLAEAKKGAIQVEENLHYLALKVNSENFDLNDGLKDQLIKEGLYDRSYVGIVVWNDSKPGMSHLPVYGDPNRWVTKHLYRNLDECIMKDARARSMNLIGRINEFRESQLV